MRARIESRGCAPSGAAGTAGILIVLACVACQGPSGGSLHSEPLRGLVERGDAEGGDEAWGAPDRLESGTVAELGWLALIWSGYPRDELWFLFLFDAQGKLREKLALEVEPGDGEDAVPPTFLADRHGNAYFYHGSSAWGSGVSYTTWRLHRLPYRRSGRWQPAVEVFTGMQRGYVGEWLGSELMGLLFPEYQGRGEDERLLMVDLQYTVLPGEEALYIRRSGEIVVEDYESGDASEEGSRGQLRTTIHDLFAIDAETGLVGPGY